MNILSFHHWHHHRRVHSDPLMIAIPFLILVVSGILLISAAMYFYAATMRV